MSITTISTKGQIVVPKEFEIELESMRATKLRFHWMAKSFN